MLKKKYQVKVKRNPNLMLFQDNSKSITRAFYSEYNSKSIGVPELPDSIENSVEDQIFEIIR